MSDHVTHPHFDHVEGTATVCYRSKATGQHYILSQRGASHGGHRAEADEVVALPALPDGTRLSVHVEPFAWGADEWDCLEAVHARR